jgi:hypothetical protein
VGGVCIVALTHLLIALVQEERTPEEKCVDRQCCSKREKRVRLFFDFWFAPLLIGLGVWLEIELRTCAGGRCCRAPPE